MALHASAGTLIYSVIRKQEYSRISFSEAGYLVEQSLIGFSKSAKLSKEDSHAAFNASMVSYLSFKNWIKRFFGKAPDNGADLEW